MNFLVAGFNGETEEEGAVVYYEEPEEEFLPWIISFSSLNLKENVGHGPIGDYFRATWKSKEVLS